MLHHLFISDLLSSLVYPPHAKMQDYPGDSTTEGNQEGTSRGTVPVVTILFSDSTLPTSTSIRPVFEPAVAKAEFFGGCKATDFGSYYY